jgi:hypothetical protein
MAWAWSSAIVLTAPATIARAARAAISSISASVTFIPGASGNASIANNLPQPAANSSNSFNFPSESVVLAISSPSLNLEQLASPESDPRF